MFGQRRLVNGIGITLELHSSGCFVVLGASLSLESQRSRPEVFFLSVCVRKRVRVSVVWSPLGWGPVWCHSAGALVVCFVRLERKQCCAGIIVAHQLQQTGCEVERSRCCLRLHQASSALSGCEPRLVQLRCSSRPWCSFCCLVSTCVQACFLALRRVV